MPRPTFKTHQAYTLNTKKLEPMKLRCVREGKGRDVTLGEVWKKLWTGEWSFAEKPSRISVAIMIDGEEHHLTGPHWIEALVTLSNNEACGVWFFESTQRFTEDEGGHRHRFLVAVPGDKIATVIVYEFGEPLPEDLLLPSDVVGSWQPDGEELRPFEVYRRFYETPEGRVAGRAASLELLRVAGISPVGMLDRYDDATIALLVAGISTRREVVAAIARATWAVVGALLVLAAAIWFR